MKLKNLTPHDITIMDGDDNLILALPRSGEVARCSEKIENIGSIEVNGHEIPIIRKTLGHVENLPKPEKDVMLVVSLAVAKAAKDRNDLLIPGQAVRDDKGRIIGTTALAKI